MLPLGQEVRAWRAELPESAQILQFCLSPSMSSIRLIVHSFCALLSTAAEFGHPLEQEISAGCARGTPKWNCMSQHCWDMLRKPWEYHTIISSPSLLETSCEPWMSFFLCLPLKTSFWFCNFRKGDDLIKKHEYFNTVKCPHQTEKLNSWVV